MTRDDTELELVHRLYDCFGRGDLTALMALLHPDVDWTWHGPAAIPYAGSRRGHTGAAEFFRAVAEAVVIEQFAPKHFIADGDTVVVIGDETARAHATARRFAISWVHVWTLRAGKVASLRCFADTAAVASAFGL
jgi:uncharacterized protein